MTPKVYPVSRKGRPLGFKVRYRGPVTPEHPRGDYRDSPIFKSKEAAEKWGERKNREWQNAKDGIAGFTPQSSNRITISELLEGREADMEMRRLKGLRQAKVHMAPLKAALGPRRALSVTAKDIADYVKARREAKAGDATIDRELENLRPAYRLAGLALHAPPTHKLVRGHENARQGFFEREEYDRLLPQLPSAVLRDVVAWAYVTGMRRGEILALSWDNYDRETGTVRLHAAAAKTGKARAIPVAEDPTLAAIVKRRREARVPGSLLIFHNGRGGKIGDFWLTFARACKRADIKNRTFHDLRRTAVRNMIRAGVARDVAKRISGHETDGIFSRYNITDERDLAEALALRAVYEKRPIQRPNEG